MISSCIDKFEPPKSLCSKVAPTPTCLLLCVLCMLCCVKNYWGGRVTKICHVMHLHYSEPGHKDTSSGGSRVIIFSKLNFKTILKIIHPTSFNTPPWYFLFTGTLKYNHHLNDNNVLLYILVFSFSFILISIWTNSKPFDIPLYLRWTANKLELSTGCPKKEYSKCYSVCSTRAVVI